MQSFRPAFFDALTAYGAKDNLAHNLWQEVEDAYTDPIRFYHNLQHLEHIYAQLQPVWQQLQQPHIVTLAIAYHDIVYDPAAADNEEQSAAVTSLRLRQLNMPGKDIIKCCAQVLVTKTHKRDDDSDTRFFTDADMSILGSSPEVYEEYTRQVRLEYAFHSDIIFMAGRRQILQHFLAMPRIYHTDHFYNLYEQQARQNITTEWECLNS